MVLLKISIFFILRYCYFLLTFIFKPKKNRYVFMSFPDYSDNAKKMYEYIQQQPGPFDLIWITADKISQSESISEKKTNNCHVTKHFYKWSILAFYHFLTAERVFHTHGTYGFINSSYHKKKIIGLWHGMPIKKLGFNNGHKWWQTAYSDVIISTSPFFNKILAKSFRIDIGNVIETGLPRNDVFLEKKQCLETKIKKQLDLEINDKYVVWLPTFRKSKNYIINDSSSNSFLDDWSELFWDEINEELNQQNLTLIIKIHPLDILNQKNQTELNKYNKIIFYVAGEWEKLNVDLYDLLAISCGLISDVSSVLIDYLYTGNKVGITTKSFENYSRGIDESINFKTQLSYASLNNSDDFKVFFSNLNPVDYSNCIYINYPGKLACRSILEALNVIK